MRGEVHHDRRLHQLMLAEASCHYDLSAGKGGDVASGGVAALCGPMSDSAGSVHSDLAAAAAAAAAAKDGVAGTSPTSPDGLFRCVLLSFSCAAWHEETALPC